MSSTDKGKGETRKAEAAADKYRKSSLPMSMDKKFSKTIWKEENQRTLQILENISILEKDKDKSRINETEKVTFLETRGGKKGLRLWRKKID